MNKPDKDELEKSFLQVLCDLGLNTEDENLKETPARLAKMFSEELFSGLYEDIPEFKTFPKKGDTFLYTKVPFTSTCAHHFQPIKGVVHIMVDYTKTDRVLGLSKFNRIVQHYAKRPTLQEDLTTDILSHLTSLLNLQEVYVSIQATHHCVTDRGVCAAFSDTVTELTYSENNHFKDKCSHRLTL